MRFRSCRDIRRQGRDQFDDRLGITLRSDDPDGAGVTGCDQRPVRIIHLQRLHLRAQIGKAHALQGDQPADHRARRLDMDGGAVEPPDRLPAFGQRIEHVAQRAARVVDRHPAGQPLGGEHWNARALRHLADNLGHGHVPRLIGEGLGKHEHPELGQLVPHAGRIDLALGRGVLRVQRGADCGRQAAERDRRNRGSHRGPSGGPAVRSFCSSRMGAFVHLPITNLNTTTE